MDPSAIGRTMIAEPATTARIYIASRSFHGRTWQLARLRGVPIVSSWIDESGIGETEDYSDLWARCVAEASGCTALVLYAPSEDRPLKGALVEVGAALAAGRPVFVVGGADGYSWCYHPLVTECESMDDAIARALATPPRPAAVAEGPCSHGWPLDACGTCHRLPIPPIKVYEPYGHTNLSPSGWRERLEAVAQAQWHGTKGQLLALAAWMHETLPGILREHAALSAPAPRDPARPAWRYPVLSAEEAAAEVACRATETSDAG